MQEHEKWLKIAADELLVAKTVLPLELFAQVAYNCQQAAEKSLKGYLAFKKHEIMKTHDLIELRKLCAKLDGNFVSLEDETEFLTPFATKFRYPSEFDILNNNEAILAIKYTENIMKLVRKRIAQPVSEQKNIFE